MDKNKRKNINIEARKKRIRAKILGTAKKPRISVFKSNKHIYAQAIDDSSGKTLASASDKKIKASEKKSQKSSTVGGELAVKIKSLGISEAIFDKGSSKYHGRIKEVAEALRSNGIKI